MNCKKSSWVGQSWKWKKDITNNYNNNDNNNNNNRGIFEGDSLYHCFLCCTWHNSERSRREAKINHLLFMDDLKLFGKSYEQNDFLVRTVHTFTRDIGMEFGIKKCGVLVLKRDKIVKMEGRNCTTRRLTRWASCEGDWWKRVWYGHANVFKFGK